MASAAAVSVDEARSPIRNNIGEDGGRPGEITSGVYAADEDLPGFNGDEDDDDEEPTRLSRRRVASNKDGVEEDEENPLDDEEDLFGEDENLPSDEAEPVEKRRLDDEELDSGDDLDRNDRMVDDAEPEPEYIEQEKVVMDMEIARQPVPEPSDGELYILKIPDFMSLEPQAWDHTTFQPPTTDHHSNQAPSATFSAYNTAMTTIRWRHSPSNPTQFQSNARINRWSDGSLTLQLASDPMNQYEIDGNALAPPQRNPIKPTPTSINVLPSQIKDTRHGGAGEGKYDQSKDAFTYLMRPHEASSSLIVTHKVTAGLTVKQPASLEDDAIERLQASLAAAANASKVNGAGGLQLVRIDEDPEAAKARALEAVRQKEKADKRHQAAIEREAARSNRALGRAGLSSSRYSGLNVGMLEDEDGSEINGRVHASPRKRDRNRRARRNSEYSEDEDLGRRHFTKEDEYDEDDGFVAKSDEEEEVVDDDEDSDDGIVEQPRQRSPKRDRAPSEDDEADAAGEEDDDDDGYQQARTKRRRIVDDEDEDAD